MLKEKGYDEFLAEKIRLGLDDIANGRTVPVDDVIAECEKIISKNIDKSIEYKAMLDNLVQDRVYTGLDSVGYTYNPEHSFGDFKKAMMEK